MHYDHPLKFGTFITPLNQAPEKTVALAKRSEELGYDLVTFQDHPYQPAFLDTWTLLSWVAGQTERIHIAANVLNVPLRDPGLCWHALLQAFYCYLPVDLTLRWVLEHSGMRLKRWGLAAEVGRGC